MQKTMMHRSSVAICISGFISSSSELLQELSEEVGGRGLRWPAKASRGFNIGTLLLSPVRTERADASNEPHRAALLLHVAGSWKDQKSRPWSDHAVRHVGGIAVRAVQHVAPKMRHVVDVRGNKGCEAASPRIVLPGEGSCSTSIGLPAGWARRDVNHANSWQPCCPQAVGPYSPVQQWPRRARLRSMISEAR